jgi:hypothetical protein
MKKNSRKFGAKLLIVLPFLFLLNSCVGLSMEIQMRRDGSGRLVLEYRISRMAESLGRLDGNENWPIIPAGRADFERTIARIPGLRLVSFSSSEGAVDVVTNVTLEYENTEALLKFLDPSGTRASLSTENQSTRLNIILNEAVSSNYDEDLLKLARQVSAGYGLSISFSAEGNSALSFTDGEGTAAQAPASAQTVTSGRKTSLSIGIIDLLEITEGLGVSFSW